jgi:hypothetical protein
MSTKEKVDLFLSRWVSRKLMVFLLVPLLYLAEVLKVMIG